MAMAILINRARIILKSCIKDMDPEPLRSFDKKRPRAGHPRGRNAVEEINPAFHDLKYVLYFTNSK